MRKRMAAARTRTKIGIARRARLRRGLLCSGCGTGPAAEAVAGDGLCAPGGSLLTSGVWTFSSGDLPGASEDVLPASDGADSVFGDLSSLVISFYSPASFTFLHPLLFRVALSPSSNSAGPADNRDLLRLASLGIAA